MTKFRITNSGKDNLQKEKLLTLQTMVKFIKNSVNI